MNNRRKVVFALGASALTAPLCSVAQPQPARLFRLGVLFAGTRADSDLLSRILRKPGEPRVRGGKEPSSRAAICRRPY
jgi:hypothetical protein